MITHLRLSLLIVVFFGVSSGLVGMTNDRKEQIMRILKECKQRHRTIDSIVFPTLFTSLCKFYGSDDTPTKAISASLMLSTLCANLLHNYALKNALENILKVDQLPERHVPYLKSRIEATEVSIVLGIFGPVLAGSLMYGIAGTMTSHYLGSELAAGTGTIISSSLFLNTRKENQELLQRFKKDLFDN